MRYLALCCDYDGTLATQGRVLPQTVLALERLIASGRRLVLVTGRELDELRTVCPRLDLFEYVVAENGALLYHPATRAESPLATRPPEAFISALRQRGVSPMSIGRVIVATWEPHETVVLETIRDLGLELQVVFNKGAVMVLPAGVNKASGLTAALGKMGLSPHNAVGVGDAENDHALLGLCECGVAVANALPTLKEAADIVTAADHGAGVAELIEELLRDDLASRDVQLTRHHILLGWNAEDEEVRISPYGESLLLVGTSGSGKSTLATGLLERLAERDYTFCVIDPEGDYDTLVDTVSLGTPNRPPSVDEVVKLLRRPGERGVVNLVGLPLADRPDFFAAALPRLTELRARTGRPHWLVIDEVHHLLPAARVPGELVLPESLHSVLQITVHPDLVAPPALASVNLLIAIGETPQAMIEEFCRVTGEPAPPMEAVNLEPGEALGWRPRVPGALPFLLRIAPSHTERRRHTRKYAEGELGPDRSFYFRGPQGKLNLRARNLISFTDLAEGVDDETWLHHLRRGDYSRWAEDVIGDETLAGKLRSVETDRALSPRESRQRVRAAVEEQYTLPASVDRSESGGSNALTPRT
jgi:HAD superfamily hydrolase (TIGR01484 family)